MSDLTVRLLSNADLDALLALEHKKWEPSQCATREMLSTRLQHLDKTSWGAFRPDGELVGSLFVMCKCRQRLAASTNWYETTHGGIGFPQDDAPYWFGISLTCDDIHAQSALFAFAMQRALEQGIRSVFLGSPVPGFAKARQQEPELSLQTYVSRTRSDKRGGSAVPADPQLYYYHQRGFNQILAAHENYFEHAAALNCAALLEYVLIPEPIAA